MNAPISETDITAIPRSRPLRVLNVTSHAPGSAHVACCEIGSGASGIYTWKGDAVTDLDSDTSGGRRRTLPGSRSIDTELNFTLALAAWIAGVHPVSVTWRASCGRSGLHRHGRQVGSAQPVDERDDPVRAEAAVPWRRTEPLLELEA